MVVCLYPTDRHGTSRADGLYISDGLSAERCPREFALLSFSFVGTLTAGLCGGVILLGHSETSGARLYHGSQDQR